MTTIKREYKKIITASVIKSFINAFFYFMSALLFVGGLTELIIPGLFLLYFNAGLLFFIWLISVFSLILYVR